MVSNRGGIGSRRAERKESARSEEEEEQEVLVVMVVVVVAASIRKEGLLIYTVCFMSGVPLTVAV